MAPKAKSRAPSKKTAAANYCKHEELTSGPSTHALKAGYRHHTTTQVMIAASGSRKRKATDGTEALLDAFPSTLGLPDDDITLDPKYPTQSKNAWMKIPERNPVTTRRSVIYVAEPAKIDESVKFMKDWSRPAIRGKAVPKSKSQETIDMDSLVAYLKAFYHGLEVRVLPVGLTFGAWEGEPTPKAGKSGGFGPSDSDKIGSVGLSTGDDMIRIRVRETPWRDESSSHPNYFPYQYQLDLNDMTDAALSLLPSDAYALLLTAEHDLYESIDDDFCCGRAWGASRVAIVSSARYNPVLDDLHGVDFAHVWPASHCTEYVDSMSYVEADGSILDARTEKTVTKRVKPSDTMDESANVLATPLELAVRAHQPTRSPTASDLRSAFLLRFCRTASHELGHCFGLDHCMYRACAMQSTSSVAEDMRQPPYLCPVCEAKVAWAVLTKTSHSQDSSRVASKGRGKRKVDEVASGWDEKELRWKKERLVAMKAFCEGHGSGFSGLAAWSAGILDLMDGTAS